MNEPIISPWLIYLIDITDPLRGAACPLAIIAIFISIILFIESSRNYDEDEAIKLSNLAKRFVWGGIMCGLIATFIPSSNTIYKMVAASYVTPANIQATGELADKAVDKVIDKIADAIQKFERSEKK